MSLVLLGAVTLSAWVGFELGGRFGDPHAAQTELTEVRQLLEAERRVIDDAQADQRAHLDALAMKIANLQAHLMRLDALGGRLVELVRIELGPGA